jgi:hypothetical protein
MLAKYDIKSVALPNRKIASFLPPVKDAISLKTPGIYRISCEYGSVYIGQSGRPSTYASRNIIGTSDWSNRKNQQWLSTVSTLTT